MSRRPLFLLLLAAVAVAGLFAGLHVFDAAPRQPRVTLETVQLMDAPRPLPPFSLQRGGEPALTADMLRGHWTLVFLGYTHCPDVCPTTLAQMSHAQKQWAALPADHRPRLLFVDVDPQRDTPETAAKYAHAFNPDTLAGTTDLDALQALAKSLSLVFMINPPEAGAPRDQYTVDHSAAMAVLDPQARLAGFVRAPFDAGAIARDMHALAATP